MSFFYSSYLNEEENRRIYELQMICGARKKKMKLKIFPIEVFLDFHSKEKIIFFSIIIFNIIFSKKLSSLLRNG
jgi:hypothetical protein